LWYGDGSFKQTEKYQRQLDQLQQQLELKQQRNKALKAEVLDLRKGKEAIEETARHDLGLILFRSIRLHTFTNACSRYDTPVFIYFAHAYLIKFWILFDNLINCNSNWNLNSSVIKHLKLKCWICVKAKKPSKKQHVMTWV
jgi:cell division protein FtsB